MPDQIIVQPSPELALIRDAVERMHRGLGEEMHNLRKEQHDANQKILDAEQRTGEQLQATNEQLGMLHADSVRGFNHVATGIAAGVGVVSGDLHQVDVSVHQVDGSVQHMSRAIVQMEVIRLINEAKGPLARMTGFTQEIDERFLKAVENVHAVRSQYDHLIGTTIVEYDRKLRTIGDHIYRLHDEDFAPTQQALTAAPETSLEFPMCVDDRRIQERTAALEGSLAETGEEVLEPLLARHRDFEHSMASSFAVDLPGVPQEEPFTVPAAVRVFGGEGKPVEVIVRGRVERDRGTAERAGLGFRIVRQPDAAEGVAMAMGGRVTELHQLGRLSRRRLTEVELTQLKVALAKLVEEGLIDRALLPGYHAYLDQFGLEILCGVEQEAP